MSIVSSPATTTELQPVAARISLRAALRQAVTDLYFNSWRLAPANLVWGAILVLAFVAGPLSLLGMALLLGLAVPTAGLYRMAALIARGEPTTFSDFIGGMGRYAIRALGVSAGAAVLAFVFTTNVLVGLGTDSPAGWFVSAMALWGLLGLGMLLVAFWPLLADPRREALGLRGRLALAGVVVIGRPMRSLALTVVVTAILVVSTVLFAALVIVSVAYVSLVSARYVLPLADEVERQLAARRST